MKFSCNNISKLYISLNCIKRCPVGFPTRIMNYMHCSIKLQSNPNFIKLDRCLCVDSPARQRCCPLLAKTGENLPTLLEMSWKHFLGFKKFQVKKLGNVSFSSEIRRFMRFGDAVKARWSSVLWTFIRPCILGCLVRALTKNIVWTIMILCYFF